MGSVVQPSELKFAIKSVMSDGYYYSSHTVGRLANLIRNKRESVRTQNTMMSDQELDFLKLTSTDLTYKEIAQKMGLTPRAIDALRDQLFLKLDVKSRVGLAMMAIRNGIVTMQG